MPHGDGNVDSHRCYTDETSDRNDEHPLGLAHGILLITSSELMFGLSVLRSHVDVTPLHGPGHRAVSAAVGYNSRHARSIHPLRHLAPRGSLYSLRRASSFR